MEIVADIWVLAYFSSCHKLEWRKYKQRLCIGICYNKVFVSALKFNFVLSIPISNQPTSVAPQSGATRGLVALRLERGSVLFYLSPIFKYE